MISATNKRLLLEFASNGFEFFPLIKATGSRKLGTPKGWPSLGTDDLAMINSWLETAKYGFGMTFGSRRCFAIDLDGAEGVSAFKDVMEELDIGTPSIVFSTPSGGRHLLYSYPDNIEIKNVSGWCPRTGAVNAGTKIDIRASGGFIGSFGARQNGYILTKGSATSDMVALPDGVIATLPVKSDTPSLSASAMAMTKELAGLSVDKSTPLYGEIPDVIYGGERDNTLFNLIASWVRSGLSRKTINMLCDIALNKCEGSDVDEIPIKDMVDRTMSSPDFMFAKRSMALQTMLDNLVFLTDMNRYILLSDKSIMIMQAVETRFANVTQDVELKSGKTKVIPVFQMWLRDHSRLTYRSMGYKPGAGTVYYDSLIGADIVNTYKQPDLPDIKDDELFNKFCKFATVICGDEEKGAVLVEFVAYLVQKPSKKIGVAPVIISTKQGIGKNFFLKVVEKMLGEGNSIILHSDNITNNFNSATSDKQLIIINESVGDGGMSKMVKTKNAQAMSRIKSMITETNQSIERKGHDIVNMKTYANFIFLSNNISAVQMTDLDRRFRCIINENNPQPRSFYNEMDVLKTKKGLGAIRNGLMDVKLTVISDYMANYDKTSDDLRVVNAGHTDVEQEILQDIDSGTSIFKSQFISKEIFMMYMSSRYGDEYNLSQCGQLMRVFFEKLRSSSKDSKNCLVIPVDMPIFFLRDVQRGGPGRKHFVYQIMKGNKVPLTGSDVDKMFVQKGLEMCIQGFKDENTTAPVISPASVINIDPELVQ